MNAEQTIEQAMRLIVDESAIKRCLVQYCRAVDRLDLELLKDVYHNDAQDDHGHFSGNAHDFAEDLIPLMGRLFIATQHRITNVSIAVNGPAATSECYYDAYHLVDRGNAATVAEFFGDDYAAKREADGTLDGQHEFVTGGRYIDRFEKRGGCWRIQERSITNEWRQIQPATPPATSGLLSSLDRMAGRRDGRDPSYRLGLYPDVERILALSS